MRYNSFGRFNLTLILIFEDEEDLLTASFIGSPGDVVGLLDVWIDKLVPVFRDGLYKVEFERVLVTVLDL